MTFQVDVEQLRAHAANVAEIQARFAAVKAASAHITQDGQAYGVLCEWISGVLEGRHTEQDELIAYQEETLGIVVKTLLVSSDDYETVDADNASLVRAAGGGGPS
ncbi:hypothetical protein [Saccharothrix algeriensis]|uniref:Excreted virulence factor EspC, type VII ESX diderm n=1 Tax=Saccharothrix algeriensis TaxID=173560 RepID=A0ABS2S2L3_9PSEU|nr:hypothetical protein [Saccharothrix algeriensis]MBM7810482.1 hypothetical protein [Saccharothrix algeriensis]